MDAKIQSIFKEIESSILLSISATNPSENDLYACSFWLFYCDYEQIHPPCFAYNNAPVEAENQWSPSEWTKNIHDGLYGKLAPLYETINSLMEGKAREEWDKLIQYQYEFYCSLCRNLNNDLSTSSSPFKSWKTTPDFIVGVFEEREDEEVYEFLLKSSIGESTATKFGLL